MTPRIDTAVILYTVHGDSHVLLEAALSTRTHAHRRVYMAHGHTRIPCSNCKVWVLVARGGGGGESSEGLLLADSLEALQLLVRMEVYNLIREFPAWICYYPI